MKASSLELLEKTQLPPAQARAIFQVMELELASRDDALAGKIDHLASKVNLLVDGFHAMELKLEALRGETRAEFQALRAEMMREIKGTLRWNFAFWVAQLAAIAGILKLLK